MRKGATFGRTAILSAVCLLFLSPLQGEGAPAPAAPPRGRVETEERGGVVVSRRFYDDDDALIEERSYSEDGRLAGTKLYIRTVDGRLAKVEAKDADGKVTGAIVYRYDGNGRLVGLSPSGELGSGNVGMISAGAAPNASWVAFGDQGLVQRFDDRGRPLLIDSMEAGKIVARSTYAYGSGPFPTRSVVEDLKAETTTTSDFDAEGHILKRVESTKGVMRAQTDFRYDDTGRLVEERGRSKGSLIVRSIEYDKDGARAREETRIDGILSETISRSDGVTAIERFYEGRLFVRSSYKDGRKFKDEFYEDDELIRTREYP